MPAILLHSLWFAPFVTWQVAIEEHFGFLLNLSKKEPVDQ